jgi:hypothetical protein
LETEAPESAVVEQEAVPTVAVEESTASDEATDSFDAASSSSTQLAVGTPFPAQSVAEAYVERVNDNGKGAVQPDVLLIEYGDFQ